MAERLEVQNYPAQLGRSISLNSEGETPPLGEFKASINGKSFDVESVTYSISVEVYPIYRDEDGNELGELDGVEPNQAPSEYRRGKKIVVGSIICPANFGDPICQVLGVKSAVDAPPFDLILEGTPQSEGEEEPVTMVQLLKGVVITQVTDGLSVYDLGRSTGYSYCAIDATAWAPKV